MPKLSFEKKNMKKKILKVVRLNRDNDISSWKKSQMLNCSLSFKKIKDDIKYILNNIKNEWF